MILEQLGDAKLSVRPGELFFGDILHVVTGVAHACIDPSSNQLTSDVFLSTQNGGEERILVWLMRAHGGTVSEEKPDHLQLTAFASSSERGAEKAPVDAVDVHAQL